MLFSEVVAVRRRVLGPEHPNTLSSMHYLGVQLGTEHRYPEAERVFREVLEIQRRIIGPEHLDTLETMNDLGVTYANEHRYTEGEKVFREAISIAREVLPYNQVTGRLFYNLACLEAVQSRREDALADLRQAVDHGFRRRDSMATDEDLKSLHGDPRFNAVLAELQRSFPAVK